MPVPFKSTQNFLEAYKGRDVGPKRAAIKQLRDASKGGGLAVLSEIASAVIGPRAKSEFAPGDLTFIDAIDDVVFEATDSSGDARYLRILEDLLIRLELVDAVSAKKGSDDVMETSVAHRNETPDKTPGILADRESERTETEAPFEHAQASGKSFDDDGYPIDFVFEARGASVPKGRAAFVSGELMNLPMVLPPPPLDGDGEKYAAWMDGSPWHPLAIGMKIDLIDRDSMDDIVEMQSEFFAMPSNAIDTYAARQPCNADHGAADAVALSASARDLGQFRISHQDAMEELAKSMSRYFAENEPASEQFLSQAGYMIRCRPALVDAIASGLDIEGYFIETGPADADRGEVSDIRGAISSRARLDLPRALDRAVLLHFSTGMPLATGLRNGLIELRHAQFCRHAGREVSPAEFDPTFNRDWFTELDAYDVECAKPRVEDPAPW